MRSRLNFLISLLLGLQFIAISCNKEIDNKENNIQYSNKVVFRPDLTSNLKNPYMGWTLYSDCPGNVDLQRTYWTMQDKASEYAGCFYLRWRWAELEPEEGKYAWEYDENFKKLIQGAVDRGLRLAFRIYVDSHSNTKQATPDYVLEKCQSWTVPSGLKTPYADDEFFLEKYCKFIEAFGKKFNDPGIVDYIDSYGLGRWGEEAHIQYLDEVNKYESHDRIVKTYEKAFDKVINVVNQGIRDEKQEKVVYEDLKFSTRRDGYASQWFPENEQKKFVSHFPQTPLIAEACYWGGGKMSDIEGGRWASWQEYYEDLVSLALETHANYLDLRNITEASRWLDGSLDQVKLFMTKGGYRIYPTTVQWEQSENELKIAHTWKNLGVGVLPNNNVHLRYKYKIKFALFNEKNEIVRELVCDNIEVSELLSDRELSSEDSMNIDGLASGRYSFAVGIINTLENDSPDIKLALRRVSKIKGEWVHISDITL